MMELPSDKVYNGSMIEIEKTRLIIGLVFIVICTSVTTVIWTLAVKELIRLRRERLRSLVKDNPVMCQALTEVAISCDLLCAVQGLYRSCNVTGYSLWRVSVLRYFALRKLSRRLRSVGLSLGFVPVEMDPDSAVGYLNRNLDGVLEGLIVSCGSVRWNRPVIIAPFPSSWPGVPEG